MLHNLFLRFARRRASAVLVLLLCQTVFVFAAAGDLDAGFGNGGQTILPLAAEPRGDFEFYPHKILLQPDGKIITVGTGKINPDKHKIFLSRQNVNGSLDADFGNNGLVFFDAFRDNFSQPLNDAALQPDGKILLLAERLQEPNGYFNKFLMRLNADGTRDAQFGAGGVLDLPETVYYRRVMIQPDGKILLTSVVFPEANGAFSIVRRHTDGSLDRDFGVNGKANFPVSTLGDNLYPELIDSILLPDGKILLGGTLIDFGSERSSTRVFFVRANADGAVDAAFGDDGKLVAPPLAFNNKMMQMLIQSDGKIVALAQHFNDGADYGISLSRHQATGAPDKKFGNRGRIYFGMLRLNYATIDDFALQPDGKILLFGVGEVSPGTPNTSIKTVILRYHSNGFVDGTYGSSGRVLADVVQSFKATTVQPDGKLLAAGKNAFSEPSPNNKNVKIFRFLGD